MKKTNRCVLLGSVTLVFVLVFSVLALTETESARIAWDPSLQLTWNHFQASPPADAVRRSELAAIYMSVSWHATYSIGCSDGVHWTSHIASVTVTSVMDPTLSWAVKDMVDAHALRHEQLHFDMSEVYRRKIESQLLALAPCTALSQQDALNQLDSQARAIGASLLQQWDSMEALYDAQTENGCNASEQARWESLINSWLSAPSTAP